jgi:hypothetical protein
LEAYLIRVIERRAAHSARLDQIVTDDELLDADEVPPVGNAIYRVSKALLLSP